MHLSQKLGLFFLVSEFLLTLTRRSRSKTGTRQDQSTLGVLWLVITASVIAGVYCAEEFPDRVSNEWTDACPGCDRALCHRDNCALVGDYRAGAVFHRRCNNRKGPCAGRSEDRFESCVIHPIPRAPGVRRVCPFFAELGRITHHPSADFRGFYPPHECGRKSTHSRIGIDLHRLHEPDEKAGSICLLMMKGATPNVQLWRSETE